MKTALIGVAVLIGAFRPVLLFVELNSHVQSAYEAAAHMLVGVLFGVWLLRKCEGEKQEPWVMQTFWAITAIEVICAGIKLSQR